MNNPTSNLTAMQGHTRPPVSDLDGVNQSRPIGVLNFLALLLVVCSPLIFAAAGNARAERETDKLRAEMEATNRNLRKVNEYLQSRNRAMQTVIERGGK